MCELAKFLKKTMLENESLTSTQNLNYCTQFSMVQTKKLKHLNSSKVRVMSLDSVRMFCKITSLMKIFTSIRGSGFVLINFKQSPSL